MDNGLLLVNFGSLQDASERIGNALNELQTKLGDLSKDGAELAETWQGTAKDAYYERQTRWTNAADDLATILKQIQLAMVDSMNDFQDTERKATQRFQ